MDTQMLIDFSRKPPEPVMPSIETRKPLKPGTMKYNIIEALKQSGRPLALHEFWAYGVYKNQPSVNTRLNELRLAGYVDSRDRKDCDFSEWYLL